MSMQLRQNAETLIATLTAPRAEGSPPARDGVRGIVTDYFGFALDQRIAGRAGGPQRRGRNEAN